VSYRSPPEKEEGNQKIYRKEERKGEKKEERQEK